MTDGTYTNTSNSSSFGLADLARLAEQIPPIADAPIYTFRGTIDDLKAALPAPAPLTRAAWPLGVDPLAGLDVVEEDGWVYIGTSRQIRAARDRWGSLDAARRFGEDLDLSP